MHTPASHEDILLRDARAACWMAALHLASGDLAAGNEQLWGAIRSLHDRTVVLRDDIAGELPLPRLADVSLS